jgi:hypothetical protein
MARELQPQAIVLNGDVLDFPTVSRHSRICWEERPTLKDEIAEGQARLREIEKASPNSQLYWIRGNHCARLESHISSRAPELEGLIGTRLADHFSDRWQHAWSLAVNPGEEGNPELMIQHRITGGQQAGFRNVQKAGCSVATGHSHILLTTPLTDWSGTKWGTQTGCLANVQSQHFAAYTETGPCSWQSGFVVFTFVAGQMMMPEVVPVVSEERGTYFHRGLLRRVGDAA